MAPQPPNPPEALAERRRAEILHHAIRHFARSGYAKADLDAVAADVGCAKGTLYRYFQNKQDLFQSAVDHVMRGLLEATSTPEREDPIDQLEDGVRAYLAYFEAHPEYVELLMLERAEFRDRPKPSYFEHRAANAERWIGRLQELIDKGRIRQMRPEAALAVIGNLLYGTIFTNYFAVRSERFELTAGDLIDVLLHGLLDADAAQRRGRP
jgi:AcrR family transcriptional regulator